MQFPKISIVTTSFNQGHYLEETILSVINQQYPNLEYIIIDGGSTDNSVEIIKKYEKHLAYWVSEKDNGMYEGVQKGFEKSTGEIMAWINSDDWYHKKTFFVVSEIFTRFPFIDWIQGLPSIIDEVGRIVSVNDLRTWSKYDFLRGEYEFIQQESCFWRRKLWEKGGSTLNTSLKYAGDFALWLKFFDLAELYCVNTIMGGFRARSKNQFSVEHLDEYRKEAASLLAIRQKNLLPGEKKNLRRIFLYKNILKRFPFISAVYHQQYISHLAPTVLYFDRMSQGFIMGEKQIRGIYKIIKSYFKNKFKRITKFFILYSIFSLLYFISN